MRQTSVGLISWLVLALAAWGCIDSRSRPTVPVFGQLAVASDPSGAEIIVDGRTLGATTPDTVAGVPAGSHELSLSLETSSVEAFSFSDSVFIPENGLASVDAALEGGCSQLCPFLIDPGRIRCRFTGTGDTCAGAFFTGEPALEWPGPSAGDYAAGGRLIAAGLLGADAGSAAGDTVATQLFRPAWAGRRPVSQRAQGRKSTAEIEYWAAGPFPDASILGLSVKQTIVGVDSATVRDVLFIRYRVENVSGDERYRRAHPAVPLGGYTFEQLYLGFALDADVGRAGDDLGTVSTDLDLAFMYDADLQDSELGGMASNPGLVGLVTVEPPAEASGRTFTFWRIDDDWDDGVRHDFAWRLLAGRLSAADELDDHPSPDIGFHPGASPRDYRVTIAHGPLSLAPGDSTTLTVALILAAPVAGTFVPGQQVAPGDPLSADRQILEVAGNLRNLAALLPQLWERYAVP